MSLRDLEYFERYLHDLKSIKVFSTATKTKNTTLSNGIHKYNNANGENSKHQKRRRRFNPLIDFNEIKFRYKYRNSKENLRRIIEIVRDDLEIDYNQQNTKQEQVPVDLQIMAAIRLWGCTEHPALTAKAHEISERTLYKISKRVASALASKASRYIRMPVTLSEKELVLRSFQDLANMPQVIGVIAHTSVRHKLKRKNKNEDKDVVDNNDNDYIYLQIVCDASHKIRDLDLRQSNEVHLPSEIFKQSRIKERFEQNEFRGRLLLGNDSLACTHFLFTPVKYAKLESEELYNRVHAATYTPAITCINLWRKRFGILNSEICGSVGITKQTITALALLHNMAMDWNDKSLGIDNNGISGDGVLMETFSLSANMQPLSVHPKDDERVRRDYIKANF